jgi:hypothetical protein
MRALLLAAPALLVLLALAPAASACDPLPNPSMGIGCSLLPLPAGGVTDIAIQVIEWASCNAVVLLENSRHIAQAYGGWALSCL